MLRLVIAALLASAIPACSYGVDWSSPWTDPQDSAAAVVTPDEYAWRVFVAISWPADIANRQADSKRPFGAPGTVVWETWANARATYLDSGHDPGPWSGLAPAAADAAGRNRFDALPLQQLVRRLETGKAIPLFDPKSGTGNETRLNQAAYEFVTRNELFNVEGQMAAAAKVPAIAFPPGAKEVKAQWREISKTDVERYHTVEVVGADGAKRIFGLTALHFTTKDLPNWFWATFEHVENPSRVGNEPWLLKSRDAFACPSFPHDCGLAPKNITLEGTKWQYFRLRGTQTDFVSSQGVPTRLANSEIERGFQGTSSCITCHSRASRSKGGQQLDVFEPDGHGSIGPPQSAWFIDASGNVLFGQLDFVWSTIRARHKAP